MSRKYNELKEQIDPGFHSMAIDKEMLSSYKSLIKDEKYFQLLTAIGNGGFFFSLSLHLYGYSRSHDFHNIDYINVLLKQEYSHIIEGLIFFGQDIFGNQFCFDERNSKIVFFNIETGDREIIAYDAEDWLGLVFDEMDYFTGYKVSEAWKVHNGLHFNQRLCPKIPFILGGEYTVDNLYASTFPAYIKTSANIAKQVYNLPDGTNFSIRVNNND